MSIYRRKNSPYGHMNARQVSLLASRRTNLHLKNKSIRTTIIYHKNHRHFSCEKMATFFGGQKNTQINGLNYGLIHKEVVELNNI